MKYLLLLILLFTFSCLKANERIIKMLQGDLESKMLALKRLEFSAENNDYAIPYLLKILSLNNKDFDILICRIVENTSNDKILWKTVFSNAIKDKSINVSTRLFLVNAVSNTKHNSYLINQFLKFLDIGLNRNIEVNIIFYISMLVQNAENVNEIPFDQIAEKIFSIIKSSREEIVISYSVDCLACLGEQGCKYLTILIDLNNQPYLMHSMLRILHKVNRDIKFKVQYLHKSISMHDKNFKLKSLENLQDTKAEKEYFSVLKHLLNHPDKEIQTKSLETLTFLYPELEETAEIIKQYNSRNHFKSTIIMFFFNEGLPDKFLSVVTSYLTSEDAKIRMEAMIVLTERAEITKYTISKIASTVKLYSDKTSASITKRILQRMSKKTGSKSLQNYIGKILKELEFD